MKAKARVLGGMQYPSVSLKVDQLPGSTIRAGPTGSLSFQLSWALNVRFESTAFIALPHRSPLELSQPSPAKAVVGASRPKPTTPVVTTSPKDRRKLFRNITITFSGLYLARYHLFREMAATLALPNKTS